MVPSKKLFPLKVLAAAAVLLGAGCKDQAPKTEDIRPVRAMVLQGSDVAVEAEFSGEVRARVESHLGFRINGKIVARKVDPGAVVKKGQVLMQLDPQDVQLSQAHSLATLRAAETARDFARAELKRYQDLKAQNFVSQTVLDSKESAFKSAQAQVDAAQAGYRSQSNQAGYASLVSDVDGVVTAVNAEVGQVVQAGAPVVQVARSGEKEVVIGLPEDRVDLMRRVADVQVRLWAQPQHVVQGKIREVSPSADPATRTYTAKVAIPDDMPGAKLGMTAMVRFSARTPVPQIKVPMSALHNERNVTSVWLVEQGAVRLVPVQPDGVSGNDFLLKSGVKPGDTIVTAGVNLLKPGQKVKILGAESAPAKSGAAAGAAAGAAK